MADSSKVLIPFEQALELVLTAVKPVTTVKVKLQESLHRILAEDVYADRDMPPFNKSAMDGYACKKEDLANELTIVEELPAGSVPGKIIGKNQCAKIMTGAMVPDGADYVLMKEHVDITGPNTIKSIAESAQSNICYRAEDLKQGELILERGTLLGASHIAILASVGIAHPLVARQPDVVLFSTGSELVEPSVRPQQQQIRNSNSYQLLAQLEGIGISANYAGIVKDEAHELFCSVEAALREAEVVIVSGAVSVGDYDYVPEILGRLGAQILFHGLNVKPGKHLLFAKLEDKFVIGLPGNPVSSFVQFELLVKPFLWKMMGCKSNDVSLKLPLGTNYSRKKADNMLFVPVSLTADGEVLPLEYHGSAHIHAYTGADGILTIPVGTCEIKKGEMVHVRPL